MRGGISDEEKKDRARAARERLRRGDHGRRVRSEERGSVSAARGAAASDGMSASPDEVSAPSEERTHLLDRLQPDEERDLPPVVCDAESAPEGPPWHYDLSDEERAAREEKRETRQEKRDRLKQKALNKTPDKLRNPSDLQVRFRTGVIYTAATVICVLAGNIPMVLMLMVVAGICAGNSSSLQGVAPQAQVLAMRVFGEDSESAPDYAVVAAIEDAVRLGADVINLSLGSSFGFSSLGSEPYQQAVAAAREQGVIVVAAAGNDGRSDVASVNGRAACWASRYMITRPSTPRPATMDFCRLLRRKTNRNLPASAPSVPRRIYPLLPLSPHWE